MQAIRKDLRNKGIPDRCSVVAAALNKQKILRGWYRYGSHKFTKYDVRDTWFTHYGETWSDGVLRLGGKRQKKQRKPKTQGLSWANTPGYTSGAAKRFCARATNWKLTTPEKIVERVGSWPKNVSLEGAAELLTQERLLRSNYRTGSPVWSGPTLAVFLKQATGKTFLEIRKEAAEKKQMKLPVLVSVGGSSTQKKYQDVQLVEPHDDATATIKATEVITRTTTMRLQMNDPLVFEAVKNLQNKRKS